MISRVIRWLARREIAEAFDAGAAWQSAYGACEASVQRQIAYAKGMLAGLDAAFEGVEKCIRERTGRSEDGQLSAEDLERARKGKLH